MISQQGQQFLDRDSGRLSTNGVRLPIQQRATYTDPVGSRVISRTAYESLSHLQPSSAQAMATIMQQETLLNQLQAQMVEISDLQTALQQCDAALQHEAAEHANARRILEEAERFARQQVGEMNDRVRVLQEDVRRKDTELQDILIAIENMERKINPLEQRERRARTQLKQMEADFAHLEERMRAELQRTRQHEQSLRQHQSQYRELERQYAELERRYEKEYQLKNQVKEIVKEVEVNIPVQVVQQPVQREVVVQRIQPQYKRQQVMYTLQQAPQVLSSQRYVSGYHGYGSLGYGYGANHGGYASAAYATNAFSTSQTGGMAYASNPAAANAIYASNYPAPAIYGSPTTSSPHSRGHAV